MQMAIEEARKSKAEDGRSHPKVGAVVVKDGRVLATAHRGEIVGCHAEYIALKTKLPDESLAGSTVYTTLEPCTERNHPKIPCASRLVERKVAKVVIGMLDPNPTISGRGQRALRKAQIITEFFPHDLMEEIEELNREFTRTQESQSSVAASKAKAPITVEIMGAKFRASQTVPSDPVGINIQFRLNLEYRGSKTMLSVHEVDVAEFPLIESALYAFFSGGMGNFGSRISLESGYSGILTCSINGVTTKEIKDIPPEISGYIVFRETFVGNLPRLGFKAAKEE
jgi:pyrimidine deaminase RibD-like protein